MVKYVEYTKVKTNDTVLEFRGGSEDVIVTNFTGADMTKNIVSIASEDEAKIDDLIALQSDEINCVELSQDDFKEFVKNSDQINNIRRQVKDKIALKYDIADEIALIKLAEDDDKRVAYQNYVDECVAFGAGLKAEVGY
jgi:hypothetical protein